MSSPQEIVINTQTIQLDQFLKWAGIIASGGEIKILLAAEAIFLNGIVVIARRKKLIAGDIIEIKDIGSWKVVTAAEK